MTPIVLATTSRHKIAEYQSIMADIPGLDWTIQPWTTMPPEIEENGKSFLENSMLKARYYAQFTQYPLIADDSGLEIDALHGEPGIYSARYRGDNTSYQERFDYILQQMAHLPVERRTARYVCVISFISGEQVITATGYCTGIISFKPAGNHGFGYDPIFFIPDHQCTMAELDTSHKNRLSHRYHAMMNLVTQWRQSI